MWASLSGVYPRPTAKRISSARSTSSGSKRSPATSSPSVCHAPSSAAGTPLRSASWVIVSSSATVEPRAYARRRAMPMAWGETGIVTADGRNVNRRACSIVKPAASISSSVARLA